MIVYLRIEVQILACTGCCKTLIVLMLKPEISHHPVQVKYLDTDETPHFAPFIWVVTGCHVRIHREGGIGKFFPRITVWRPEGWIFLSHPHKNN